MNTSPDQAAYRIRRPYRKGMPKGYRYTLEAIDDHTQQVMASCDIMAHPAHSTLAITDDKQQVWSMSPNRKVMPSRWVVTDPEQRIVMQFDQKIMQKLTNPLYKVAFTMLDGEGREVCRVADPRTNVPDRIFGVGPDEWIVVDGDRLVAKLVRLPGRKKPSPGLLGRLTALLTTSDPGIVSIGSRHAFPAPVALGMQIIFSELANVSAGAT